MGNKNVTFHIQRYPGVNTELDYAGKTLVIHNRRDPDDLTPVTIFVATLSFSDYFYIEGLTSCDIGNWIRAYLEYLLERRPSADMTDEQLEKLAPWNDDVRRTCGNNARKEDLEM